MAEELVMRGWNAAAVPGYKTFRASDDGSQVVLDRYQELALRGRVYSITRAAVTLPVNAATLVSLAGIYNPPSSGVFLELIDVAAHYVVATTVVNALGVYYSQGTNATGATFTTQIPIENARVGEGSASSCRAYSSVTHVGTPVLKDIVGGWGAVTDGGSTLVYRKFGGSILFPPGTLVALAMTTAAATTSGVTLSAQWAEIPYTAI